MQVHLKIFVIFMIIFFAIFSCSKNKEKDKTEEKVQIEKETEEREEAESKIDKEFYEEEFNSTLEEIGTIQEFTPESFVKVTILYKKMTRVWLEETMTLPSEEQKEYLDLENQKFFDAFGITEEQFIEYSQENIEELNKYMEDHPELISELQKY
jgi:hypothetical protein